MAWAVSMFTSKTLLCGDMPDVRVGIGRGTDNGNVERSVLAMDGHDVTIYDDPYELTDDLASGRIDAAVRGDMASSMLLPILKSKLNLPALERVAFLEPLGGKLIILAPVGIDEGWTDDQRYDLAARSAVLAKKVGMGSRIAIMSGGRCEDMGRCKAVDRSIESARAISHSVVSTKRTPKLNVRSATADDRRVDVLIPIIRIATCHISASPTCTASPYVATFIGSGISIPITFSGTIK